MPVLGADTPGRLEYSASTPGAIPRAGATYISSSGGIIIVPHRALDRWFTYRKSDTTATTRKELVAIGDSTTFGSEATGIGYSWLQRLIDRLAARVTVAGKGMVGAGESFFTYDAPQINALVSTTFAGTSDQFDLLGGQFWFDDGTTAGHTLTLQFKETGTRLWYTARGNAGEFTYAVDGGAPTIVSAYQPGGTFPRFIDVSGLADTTHTVVVTNRGGRTALPPTGLSLGVDTAGTGTLASGTYYYVATHIFGGGETVASPVASITTPGTRGIGINIPVAGQDSARIYRSTSASGPFEFITATPTATGGTTVTYYDNGIASTPASNPPTVGTTNLNTSSKGCWIALSPMNATGVAVQKYATSGGTMSTFLTSAAASIWAAFGLTYNGGDKALASSYAVDTSYAAGSRIKPVLAILHLGFNDLTNQVSTDYSLWTNGVNYFAAMCRAAGCDGLVLSGQLPYNAKWPTYGAAVFAALRDTAVSNGLAFADFFYPVAGPSLSYAGGSSNPHLPKVQYQAQADWLWDNLLGL